MGSVHVCHDYVARSLHQVLVQELTGDRDVFLGYRTHGLRMPQLARLNLNARHYVSRLSRVLHTLLYVSGRGGRSRPRPVAAGFHGLLRRCVVGATSVLLLCLKLCLMLLLGCCMLLALQLELELLLMKVSQDL